MFHPFSQIPEPPYQNWQLSSINTIMYRCICQIQNMTKFSFLYLHSFVIIHEKCSREDEAAIDLILCFSFRVTLIIAMHWEYIYSQEITPCTQCSTMTKNKYFLTKKYDHDNEDEHHLKYHQRWSVEEGGLDVTQLSPSSKP